MQKLARLATIVSCLAFGAVARGDGPRIEATAEGYRIMASFYTAAVDATGTLTSIVVGGAEFLAPTRTVHFNGTPHVLRAINASPMNQWLNTINLTGHVTSDGNSLRAEGDGWWLRYTFTPDAIELEYDAFSAPGKALHAPVQVRSSPPKTRRTGYFQAG